MTTPTTASASSASDPDSRLTRLSRIGPELQPDQQERQPVSKNTIRSQISRCCSRAPAVSDADPKRPKYRPVATTARTPDAPTLSAGR